MRSINILATQRISTADRAKIEAADPAVQLIDAGGWFDGEIRETFTAYAAARYLAPHSTGSGSREARPSPRRGGGDTRRMALSTRSVRQSPAAEMASSAASGRQQPAWQ
jgi:hypothetical protein